MSQGHVVGYLPLVNTKSRRGGRPSAGSSSGIRVVHGIDDGRGGAAWVCGFGHGRASMRNRRGRRLHPVGRGGAGDSTTVSATGICAPACARRVLPADGSPFGGVHGGVLAARSSGRRRICVLLAGVLRGIAYGGNLVRASASSEAPIRALTVGMRYWLGVDFAAARRVAMARHGVLCPTGKQYG